MIHSLWILKNNICIFHLDCGCLEVDQQLFSGFLSALSLFSKETIQREINSLIIQEFKFIFEKHKDLNFILSAEKKDNDYLLHKKLIRIQIHFFNKYDDVLSNWNGEISKFNSFGEKAEKIITCSIEGTEMYCEYCERIIMDKFITKSIDFHDYYFCGEICKDLFEKLYSKFIPHTKHFEMDCL
ncbi:MAG: hypothetical protein ACTSO2_14760 [Promethearchaeota archaeon]